MLELPSVTLVCVDCVDVERAVKAVDRCKAHCRFGASKFLTSLPTDHPDKVECRNLHTLTMYSVFMLAELHKYIDTEHMLVVQRDGWVINPGAWEPSWLQYDYIGPLFNQYDHVGAGGFSFRSSRMMREAAERTPDWDGTPEDAEAITKMIGYYEDGTLCFGLKSRWDSLKYTLGSVEDAAKFAAGGNQNPKYFVERPFGFHAGTYYEKTLQTPGWKMDNGIVEPHPIA